MDLTNVNLADEQRAEILRRFAAVLSQTPAPASAPDADVGADADADANADADAAKRPRPDEDKDAADAKRPRADEGKDSAGARAGVRAGAGRDGTLDSFVVDLDAAELLIAHKRALQLGACTHSCSTL